MNDYQQEQFEALFIVKDQLSKLTRAQIDRLKRQITPYLDFRSKVDQFLNTYFSSHCTQSCYENRRSACCSKDGIVTFWADVVINALCSTEAQLCDLEQALAQPTYDHKCTYLGRNGCRWQVRPLMCAMFLCDQVKDAVFPELDATTKQDWNAFFETAKSFRWPDKPVLFDSLETYFMALGVRSSLMYINTSPGLLRIKQRAGY